MAYPFQELSKSFYRQALYFQGFSSYSEQILSAKYLSIATYHVDRKEKEG